MYDPEKDIFEQFGIIDSKGDPMKEDNVNPHMGYRIVHKITGRILPQTQRYEIMGYDYAKNRINGIVGYYKILQEPLNIQEYILEPVYFSELEDMKRKEGYLLLYTPVDEKNKTLFKGKNDPNINLNNIRL